MRYIPVIFLFFYSFVNAQDRFASYKAQLEELSMTQAGLDEKVDLAVTDMSIQDFIQSLAKTYNLNISVDNTLNQKVVTNFSDVTVAEVLMFVCKKYDLDLTFIGNIINVGPHIIPPPEVKEFVRKPPSVTYDTSAKTLSLELNSDTLLYVTREISKRTGLNIIVDNSISNKPVSCYIINLAAKTAIIKMAESNGLSIDENEPDVLEITKSEVSANQSDRKKQNVKARPGESTITGLTIHFNADSSAVDLNGNGVSVGDLINAVSSAMHKNYFIFSDLKGTTNLSVTNMSYDDLLALLFNGTEFTFTIENGIYLIGARSQEGLRRTEVFSFRYRTYDKVVEAIPAELTKGIELKPFPDLNSLILSGSQPRIEELKKYLRDLDRVVPLIQIEVLIMDIRNSRTVSAGLKAGLGSKPAETSGAIYPGLDMTLNASSVNNLIDGINGFGILNLGKVTPNFYVTIKALEQQGILKLKSTPKLATLNGHEAKLSIGRTEYYLELQSSVVGIQNPFPVQSQQYKSVNADLSVTINPIVSGDGQITLDITVKQSNFTERISQTAPPGNITRDFKSLVRVRSDEMIMLGGLDENSTNDTGEGVPLLSRIPVLKWLFSTRTRTASKNKLSIFIKPTVLY